MTDQQATVKIHHYQLQQSTSDQQPCLTAKVDVVAAEQPLQIMVSYFDHQREQWLTRQLAVVMRTPGQDRALVFGYLMTQGVIEKISDVTDINLFEANLAEVSLDQALKIDWSSFTRLFASHSGCGVCGQAQLKQLALKYVAFEHDAWLESAKVFTLPEQLKAKQQAFMATGGMHGAAIWQNEKLRFWAEDVGRHNAVDKVIGQLLQDNGSAKYAVLILSGRISFELVQKALVAGISAIVAVGAPSDLAIATAKQFNQTLIGFVKSHQANVYCGEQQLKR